MGKFGGLDLAGGPHHNSWPWALLIANEIPFTFLCRVQSETSEMVISKPGQVKAKPSVWFYLTYGMWEIIAFCNLGQFTLRAWCFENE